MDATPSPPMPPKENPLFDEWLPIWKAKVALDAGSYHAVPSGVTRNGRPRLNVTFFRGRKNLGVFLGVELVSKAGKPYVSINLGNPGPKDSAFASRGPRASVIRPAFTLSDLY